MGVPAGVALPFDGTAVNIPANWSRDTAYDGRYPLGAASAADGGTNGGSATHTHNIVSHTHSFSGGAASGVQLAILNTIKGYASTNHTHGSATSNSSAQASGTASNDPLYYEVIFVTPSSGEQDVPQATGSNDIVGLFDDTLPTNWSNYTAFNGYYLKGAAGGSDPGGTGGSLDSHTHNTDHTHAAKNSGNNVGSSLGAGSGAPSMTAAANLHNHSVSLNSGSANAANADGIPPYRNLIGATNSTTSETPIGLIGLYDGAAADVGTGVLADWERVSAQDDKFLRCNSSVSTGGADTHTHSASSAHNHTATAGNASVTKIADRSSPIVNHSKFDHTHTWTIGTTSAGLSANTSKSNYPLYRTTIFIKFIGSAFKPQIIWI